MVEEFVREYVKLLANHPEDIEVVRRPINDTFSEITIYAHRSDVGKIIGKEGKMIGAIKTVISGCKAKDRVSYKVNVQTKG